LREKENPLQLRKYLREHIPENISQRKYSRLNIHKIASGAEMKLNIDELTLNTQK